MDLSYSFGKYTRYWYGLEQHLRKYRLVGTTVRTTEQLPQHLFADEKHTRIGQEKAYIATTSANEGILGTSVVKEACCDSLTQAYGVFKEEAQDIQPDYTPKTVNTDGWKATQKAWKNLFLSISLIACFLPVFIGIRDRAKKSFKEGFEAL